MVKFEGKNLGEKVEDKILGKILVQKYWLQKMNTSFVHQVLWLKFCAEKVEDKIWGKILVQKYWLQNEHKFCGLVGRCQWPPYLFCSPVTGNGGLECKTFTDLV